MSDDTHLLQIREERIRRLRVIESQIATFGMGYAPTHLLVEAAELRGEIGIVDSAVSSPISSSISDDLQPSGRFKVYYEQWRLTQQIVSQFGANLDRFIEETRYWRQSMRFWIILISILVFILSLATVGIIVYVASR